MHYISSENRPTLIQNSGPTTNAPIRVLHVVGGMNRGGIETWLMHVLRRINRDRVQMDFLVHVSQACDFDEEVRQLGSRIIPCLTPSKPRLYATHFKQIMREHGPYDIVHSHVHHFSGYVLKLAHDAGVPVRIAHSHTDISSLHARTTLRRSLYLNLMKYWIHRYATLELAISEKSAQSLFGRSWASDPRCRLLFCGIDLTPFKTPVAPNRLRAEFNLPSDAFVIGHVGRFVEPKNHRLILNIMHRVVQQHPNAYLFLVGEGSLRPAIEQQIEQLHLGDRVIFAGVRSDVDQLMRGVMDVFLFPSLYEGLGMAFVEAQAAGLPCIISDVIPREGDVVSPLIRRLSLSQPISDWVDAVLSHRPANHLQASVDALQAVINSPLNVETIVQQMEHLYQDCSRLQTDSSRYRAEAS